ncbi:hypothetical protein S83_003239, partial [Arachis hypogaea]
GAFTCASVHIGRDSAWQCWVEDSYLSTKDVRNDKQLKSLTLLLKCLKIMKNATFLSEDNQAHFLGLKRNLIPQATLFSFVELILTIIKFLSEMFHFYWIKDSRHKRTASFTHCQMTCPYVAMIWKKKLQGLMIFAALKYWGPSTHINFPNLLCGLCNWECDKDTVREGKHVFGVAHIFASFNDTFIHVTDLSRKKTLVRIT